MKTVLIIIGSLVSIVAIAQVMSTKSTNDTETHRYKVLKTIDNVEIRKYEKAIFTSVDLNSDSYKEVSRKGFRVLAGYIFGGNEENEKIAMTSPVTMSIDKTSEMRFMVPSNLSLTDLPKPNDSAIEFVDT